MSQSVYYLLRRVAVVAMIVGLVIVAVMTALGGDLRSNVASLPTTSAGTGSGTVAPTAAETTPVTSIPVDAVQRPAEWPAPDPQVARASVRYLSGPGASITSTVTMISRTAKPSPQDCRATGEALDVMGGRSAFLTAAGAVADPAYVELLADFATLAGDALAACVNSAPETASAFMMVEQVVGLLELRMIELVAAQ
jgi:hypothetical protein